MLSLGCLSADALPTVRGVVAARQLHRHRAGPHCVCVHVQLCLGTGEGAVNFANTVSVSLFQACVMHNNAPAWIAHTCYSITRI